MAAAEQIRIVNRSRYALSLVAEGEPAVLVPSNDGKKNGEITLPKAQWETYKAHRGAQKYLKRGWIVEVSAARVKKNASAKSPLTDLDVDDALEHVSFQAAPEDLEAWLESETRDPVRAAINKRLRLLAKG